MKYIIINISSLFNIHLAQAQCFNCIPEITSSNYNFNAAQMNGSENAPVQVYSTIHFCDNSYFEFSYHLYSNTLTTGAPFYTTTVQHHFHRKHCNTVI